MRLPTWLRRVFGRTTLAQQGGMIVADGRVKSASISAVVYRADGRVEDLGVISKYERED